MYKVKVQNRALSKRRFFSSIQFAFHIVQQLLLIFLTRNTYRTVAILLQDFWIEARCLTNVHIATVFDNNFALFCRWSATMCCVTLDIPLDDIGFLNARSVRLLNFVNCEDDKGEKEEGAHYT